MSSSITLQRFAQGELKILCNCAVLTEGWDMAPLEVCIVARGVGHAGLWLQMIGRVLRSSPGKEFATVLDLTGNVHLHGPPEAERFFSLTKGIELAPTSSESEGRCLTCEGPLPCSACNPRGIIQMVATGAKLVPFDTLAPRLRDDELKRLTEVAVRYGYKPGWVWFRFKERFNAEIPLATYTNIKRCIEASQRRSPTKARPSYGRVITGRLSF